MGVNGHEPDPSGEEQPQPFFSLIPREASLTGGRQHSVGQFEDQQERGGEAYPVMKEEIVSQRKRLGHRLLIVQLPFENHRRIHDNGPRHYRRLPSRINSGTWPPMGPIFSRSRSMRSTKA